ncbi:extracellular solute-binding protein [Brachybacterium huguangmaarense]|uniref:Extracellular solute-binding protein n=1 Tax=Brachybacterium huguangmaarense TaxID=1652028 RepID=A0ABY6G1P6_9MICO|nr:extracellular solute-binding protein [Brachybacterium huguangmaarense]UYG17122.1 extracellular solute-binding protein [Brachybacterium huguangmaarense]
MSNVTHGLSRRRLLTGASAAALGGVLAPTLSACGGGGGDSTTFTIQQYESKASAQYKGWEKALEIFKGKHPDLDVKLVQTSFDNMQKNAKIILSGRDVPDVVEVNKGNADAGQLSAQGLLIDLSEQVTSKGWDKKVVGTMAALAQYTPEGNAGSGAWFGVPNIGEYVQVYYNADMFAEAGIQGPPDSLAAFQEIMDVFIGKGQAPLSSSANTNGGWGAMWTWYSLVSAFGSREQMDDYMFLRGSVDFSADPWKRGTDLFAQWVGAGYLGSKIAGVNSDQAQVAFIGKKFPMLLTNSGAYSTIADQADFAWDSFILPEAQNIMGSSGHLWAVPADAPNPDLAYEWIDITLSEEVQNEIGKLGGLPLAGDPSVIEDEKLRAFTETFDSLKEDKMSYYADYPVPGFIPTIQAGMQGIANGTTSAEDFLADMQTFYDDGKETVLGG